MSVSFQGVGYTLDLSNGTAGALLTRMGHESSQSTDGEMTIHKAIKGVAAARKFIYARLSTLQIKKHRAEGGLTREDADELLTLALLLDNLWDLSDLIDELQQAGGKKLAWF